MADAAVKKKLIVEDEPQAGPAPTTAPADVPVRVLAHQKNVRRKGELFTTWECTAEVEHTLADVMSPWYFWRRAQDMSPGDRIEVRHPYHAYLAEFYVVNIDNTAQALVLKPLSLTDLTTVTPISANMEGCVVMKFGSDWCVQQGPICIKRGFGNGEEALAWLKEEQERRRIMFIKK